MNRTIRRSSVCAALVSVLAVAAAAAGVPTAVASGGPTATAARACSVGSGRSFGPTYVIRLSVRNTSCATGRSVVRSYYRCRIRHGGRRGRCSGTQGYRCSERRSGIPTQFNAVATCKKGIRRVVHTYQQNTF